MAAGKQKNTPVIVMKKKRHIISPPPPKLPSGTVENKIPAHHAKKTKKWTPEFINTSLEKVKTLFPLLQAEEGGFRPLKIGITKDVTDFTTQNPGTGLTLPERNCLLILALVDLAASCRQRNTSTFLCRNVTSQASTGFRSESHSLYILYKF